MENTFIVALASAAISAVLTYFFVTHYRSQRIAASEAGDDRVLDLRLSNEFQKGKEAGKLEELEKFTITCEPFTEKVEEYLGLKKTATLGYYLHIQYAGFRIGHESRYVTHQSIEYDEKRIDALLNNEVASAINGAIHLAATKGMTTKKLPTRTKAA